jgi:hypothetical protein
MSDEEHRLEGIIVEGAYSRFWNGLGDFTFSSLGTFTLPDDEEWKALGEDPDAGDLPLILRRVSDGQYFEIDIDVSVRKTSPESRREQQEMLEKQAARMKAAQAAGEGAPGG